ncbi:MAG: hemolysin family protein [Massiliimalia sp.]
MLGAILLQVILIGVNAVFAGAEIAVVSMNGVKLKNAAEQGNRKAQVLLRLTENPARFLATIQVAITLSGYLGSAYATDNFSEPLVHGIMSLGIPVSEQVLRSVCPLVISLIMAYFGIVFGELIPKRIAMQNKEGVSYGLSGLLSVIAKIFVPLVWLLTASTNFFLKLMHIDTQAEEQVSEEEIRMIVSTSCSQGEIESNENELIQNVFEFNDVSLEEICTHRTEVEYLSLEDTDEEWEQLIFSSRHSMFPVCGERQDHIMGILDSRIYLRSQSRSREHILKTAVKKPFFVLEGMKADDLFFAMKQSGNYFAVVLDEYGGFTGIVTLRDLMEILVGELEDVSEPEKPEDIRQIDEHTWLIQGCADLEEIDDLFQTHLAEDEYDTFSGYLLDALGGQVPDEGEDFELELGNMKIYATMGKGHRVQEARVTDLRQDDSSEKENR